MENLISMRNLGVDKINSLLKLAENLETGK